MNTLGYAILSALGRKPCSGYELVQYLDAVWPAKHSQIYPRLSKMEQNGLLVFEEVVQTGKPDKKIFSITEKGRETLEKWVTESPSDPIMRDEFLIKINSIWLSDEESAKKLIQDRISNLEQKVAYRADTIAELEQKHRENTMSKHFGRYLLFNRRNMMDKEEISWCEWVLNLLEKTNFNISKLMLWLIGAGKLNLVIQNMMAVSEI
ncbi:MULTISPECIES: PadR family transcriptional regulator [Bacillaceae]|uniref:DNA-binding PadR family transcriptional regulator n=1 Tax=Peribacillus huizhouensis TaxID=1501239 RepID=A0ABR6CLS0_9BACI|nr:MULTISPECIES: PadR family transcriptional regulator [Bacillaceae]MBA9025975.1 DNA-binding PadR family transcriptional regulator [Peribacillus huizhouensis]